MSSLFGVLAVVAVLLVTANAEDCDHGHSDGCSIPGHLPFFYKEKFRHACNKHDICYDCGTRYGISKDACDHHLQRDALSVCRGLKKRLILESMFDAATQMFCDEIAETYYGAVNAFGAGHFSSSPRSYCGESWVKSCVS